MHTNLLKWEITRTIFSPLRLILAQWQILISLSTWCHVGNELAYLSIVSFGTEHCVCNSQRCSDQGKERWLWRLNSLSVISFKAAVQCTVFTAVLQRRWCILKDKFLDYLNSWSTVECAGTTVNESLENSEEFSNPHSNITHRLNDSQSQVPASDNVYSLCHYSPSP